jgi:hypothetical protein
MTVKIKAAFKKAERTYDGLADIEAKLVNEDLIHERYMVVAIVRPHRLDLLADDATKSATIKFDHIEVGLEEEDIAAIKAILARRLKERTGRDSDEQMTINFGVPGGGPESDTRPDEWTGDDA